MLHEHAGFGAQTQSSLQSFQPSFQPVRQSAPELPLEDEPLPESDRADDFLLDEMYEDIPCTD